MSQVSSSTASQAPSVAAGRVTAVRGDARPVAASAVSVAGQVPDARSQSKPSAQEIQRASDDLQQRVAKLAPELQFSVDEASGRSVIKFTDRATHEVIRQFPTEEALHITRVMDQFQRGLLFNRNA